MTDFARRIGHNDIEVPASGQVALRVDGTVDVNLVYDSMAHRIHLFALIDPPATVAQPLPAPFEGLDRDWTCAGYECDGIDWALRWHEPSGLTVRSASASAAQLDSVRFCELFEQFVDHLLPPTAQPSHAAAP